MISLGLKTKRNELVTAWAAFVKCKEQGTAPSSHNGWHLNQHCREEEEGPQKRRKDFLGFVFRCSRAKVGFSKLRDLTAGRSALPRPRTQHWTR